MNPHLSLSFRRAAAAVLFACLAAPTLPAADNVTVGAQTYTTTQTVQADNTIATTGSVVVGNTANITFQAGAGVSLGTGFKINSGGLFRVNVGQSLPYAASFETAEGFTTGSIANQRGWLLLQSAANVSTADPYLGSNSLVIPANTAVGAVQQVFLVSSAPAITFVDLYARPVAGYSPTNSSVVQTESAFVGFQIVAGQGEVFVYDGVGANQWIGTGMRFDLDANNQSIAWLRLTLRADYTNKKWDLFVNGRLVEYDLAFSHNSETFLRQLILWGASSAAASFDGVAAQTTNPLFTDADKDGLPDAWETANGLNTAVNDRGSNFDGDAYANIEEYFRGTLANNADVTVPTVPTTFQVTGTTTTSITLSWSGAGDAGAGTSGVAGYRIYRYGQLVNSSLITGTTFTDTGLTSGSAYSYTIRTVDLAGNLSAASSAIAGTTAISSTSGALEVFSPL